jgi:hypothetical protein
MHADMKTGTEKLGTIELDMGHLRRAKLIQPRMTEGKRYYDVVVRVYVKLLEGFRHTIGCSAEWAQELQDDIDLDPNWVRPSLSDGEDVDMLGENVHFNISAHFQPSTA